MTKTISFIGTGKMATALISAISKNNMTKSIIATNKDKNQLKKIKFEFKKVKTTTNNKEAVRKSEIAFICVKPQDIDTVLKEIRFEINNQLIVSIAAGIKIKHIEKIIGKKRIIRVMPNLNCIVGEMAAGFSAGKYATKKDIKEVERLLNCAGAAYHVKEDLIDAVTAVSGSGPAFFAYFMEAMAKAGIKHGLKKDIAYKLAAKTALGTGKLLLEKNIEPDELIKMVASKKGVTLEGLKILNKYKTDKIIEKTIDAAVKRSKELGR